MRLRRSRLQAIYRRVSILALVALLVSLLPAYQKPALAAIAQEVPGPGAGNAQPAGAKISDVGGAANYVYDALGRLKAVVDPAGYTAAYNYDAVGNVLSIARRASSQVAILEFSPRSGAAGANVTIYGTAFSSTPLSNTVKFNGVVATVLSAESTQIVAKVPSGVTNGPISVTTAGSSATSAVPFTVAASQAPIISGISPTIADRGAAVILTGNNFDPTPANNVISVNSLMAAPNAAATTRLTATLNSNVTSGKVVISTPAGQATSGVDLYVPPTPYVAADVAFTARMVAGTSRIVRFPVASKIGLVLFDGVAGQQLSLTTSNSTVDQGNIAVIAPSGQRVVPDTWFGTGATFADAMALPATGTYTIMVAPYLTSIGQVTLSIYNASDVTGALTPGTARTVSLPTPGQNARLTFTAGAGQWASLRVTAATIANGAMSVLQPNGETVSGVTTNPQFMDAVSLPVSGTYTLLIDPAGTATGSVSFTLYVFSDVTGSVTPNAARTVATTLPGQNARLTFSGAAGQRVGLRMTSSSISGGYVSVLQPNGSGVTSGSFDNSGGFMDAVSLPVSGSYTLLIDPSGSATGNASFTLYSFSDVSGAIAPGTPMTVTLAAAGQKATLTFSASAGQKASLRLTNSTIAGAYVHLQQPGGAEIASSQLDRSGAFVEATPLQFSGTYRIILDSAGINTGSVTFSLYTFADATGTVTSGVARTISLSSPSQNARLTFSGAAGQRVGLSITSSTIGAGNVTILQSSGDAVASLGLGPAAGYMSAVALPSSGTYTLLIDPEGIATGSITFTLYVFSDVAGAITPGTALTLTVAAPEQNAAYTFSGSAGQKVSLLVTRSTFAGAYAHILQPDGTELAYAWFDTAGTYLDATLLPSSGTYKLVVDPQDVVTGTVNFAFYTFTDVTGAITLGTAKLVTLARPGQNAALTFTGSAGQQVSAELSASTIAGGWVSILAPDGSELAKNWFDNTGGFIAAAGLPVAGTYTLLVDPYDADTGSVTIKPSLVTRPQAPVAAPKQPNITARPTRPPQASSTPVQAGKEQSAPSITPPSAPKNHPAGTSLLASPVAKAQPPQTAGGAHGATPTPGKQETEPAPASSATPRPKNAEASKYRPATSEEWLPQKQNFDGTWLSGRSISPWQSLAALRAGPGVTALSGEVLRLDGQPLANVTLSIKGLSARTDDNGQFLLTGLTPGHWQLKIDGRSANQPGKTYGIFQAGVDLVAGRTTVLPYIIWMPLLDTQHTVKLASPTAADVVVTTPYIPGLELRIPKGTVVRDGDGHIVTEIGITAIPVDRPPYPLPLFEEFPVYFTIQPGGAYLSPNGGQLIYPNYAHAGPGSRASFWFYDPSYEASGDAWRVYGKGTVLADGKLVSPDAGTRIYQTMGASYGFNGGTPPDGGPNPGPGDGDPVNLSTGLFVMEKTDLHVADVAPLELSRTYRPNDAVSRSFGVGTTLPYDMFLGNQSGYDSFDLVLPDGARVHYVRIAGSTFQDYVFESRSTPTEFHKSQVTFKNQGWELALLDGIVYVFSNFGVLEAIRDRFGNTLTITHRDAGAHGWTVGPITEIRSPGGRWIAFSSDDNNRIVQAMDSAGRIVHYSYDDAGRLASVTDAAGGITRYTYDANGNMATISDARNIVFLTNQYDAGGRVTKQTQADGTVYTFDYTLDVNGKISQTIVTNPRGYKRRLTFNTDGYVLTDTQAYGTTLAQTVTYARQAVTNLVLAVTDALGRKTTTTFDALGRPIKITYLAGTASAVSNSYTYLGNTTLRASYTDALTHTTTYAYNSLNQLTAVTDPLGNTTRISYNVAGQPVSLTDPLNHTTLLSYSAGLLTGVTDPLGRTDAYFKDGAGRVTGHIDALGNRTLTTFDGLNNPVKIVDALGGVTQYAYDRNSNLLTLTDARNNATSYTYDVMDRLSTRTDALAHVERFEYDASGNLTKDTDRKGQVTTFTYEALDRLAKATYADSSSMTLTFDAGNRLTKIVDPSGTISRSYDGRDHVLAETTALGNVTYGYDAAGRRSNMTVAGQTAVVYTYDNADRLTGISQGGTANVQTFDAASRALTASLPNGVGASYSYNPASQLLGVTYTRGSTTLGTLQYSYDAAGRVASVGGTLAAVTVPQAMTSASYNAANEATQWGGISFTYDLNGNLTSNGTRSYTWDVRNRLVSITGEGTTAVFTYDALGRRISKMVNGASTGYLYDQASPVQELSGTTPTANLLNGLSIDSLIARTDGSGTSTLIKDGLGSSLALVNGTGVVATSYAYEPFGKTTVSGAASTNSYQYAGRENDGTGLYYNRARYYDPNLQRFISQDPLGFGGGDLNLYAYVRDNPITLSDPSGLRPIIDWGPPDRGDGSPNGCGSGKSAEWVPDRIGGANFRPSCDNHDDCYSACGAPKLDCDMALSRGVMDACKDTGADPISCSAAALTYLAGVVVGGGSAYSAAQASACSPPPSNGGRKPSGPGSGSSGGGAGPGGGGPSGPSGGAGPSGSSGGGGPSGTWTGGGGGFGGHGATGSW